MHRNNRNIDVRRYIGMRNLKTAIAVVLSVIVAEIFGFQSAFFVATGALISMETTVEKGIRAGLWRILGTVMGACIGIIMVMIDEGNLILLFLGIIIIISLLNLLNWHEAISMACIVFCVIMINITSDNTVAYAVERTIDTTMGIIIASVVNGFIFPPDDKGKEIEVKIEDDDVMETGIEQES